MATAAEKKRAAAAFKAEYEKDEWDISFHNGYLTGIQEERERIIEKAYAWMVERSERDGFSRYLPELFKKAMEG